MSQLASLVLDCETVTPLFLAGADPRGAPELRPPSLRGALRYWFRALTGIENLDELRRAEEAIFGSQSRASPLAVRMEFEGTVPVKSWQTDSRRGEVWPQGSGGSRPGQVNGLAYLGFSFQADRVNQARRAIDAEWPFRLTLTSRSPDVLALAQSALWTLLHLGGLGSRTRRGFGGIRVTSASGDVDPSLPTIDGLATTPADLSVRLADGLRLVRQRVGPGEATGTAAYTTLDGSLVSAIVLGQTWTTWNAALRDVGQVLAEQRRGLAPGLAEVALAPPRAPRVYSRPGFGLPIGYYGRQAGRVTLSAMTGDRRPIDRRASPLWIRPIRLTSDYAILLWLSQSRFLPEGSALRVAGRNVLPGDVSLDGVRRFVEVCGERWSSHPVMLP